MYEKLYQYLLQHKELPVPGTGTFLLERKAAEIDFPNKRINPPVHSIAMQQEAVSPSKQFFTWLAAALHTADREAVIRFNDFAFDLKKQIADGGSVNWNGVGTLSKGLAGDVKFAPITPLVIEKPVIAEKVIRDKAEHMVRVGEDEKTSAEMTEMLNKPASKKSFWWAYALAAGLLAIMFIGWYFSEHGVDVSSIANEKKIVPTQAEATYKLIP